MKKYLALLAVLSCLSVEAIASNDPAPEAAKVEPKAELKKAAKEGADGGPHTYKKCMKICVEEIGERDKCERICDTTPKK